MRRWRGAAGLWVSAFSGATRICGYARGSDARSDGTLSTERRLRNAGWGFVQSPRPQATPSGRAAGACHPEPRRPLRGLGGGTRRPSRVPAVSPRPVSGGVSLPAVARLLPAALRRPPSPPPRPPGLAEHEAPAESPLCDEERQLPRARWGRAGGVTADGVKSKAVGAEWSPLCQPAWAPRQQLPAGPNHPRALC